MKFIFEIISLIILFFRFLNYGVYNAKLIIKNHEDGKKYLYDVLRIKDIDNK